MAKAGKSQQGTSANDTAGLSPKGQEILQRISHEGLLIGLVALVIYLMLALLSYSAADPGWSSTGSGTDAIDNLAGPTGAWLSDRLFSWFGKLAYLLPLIFVYQSVIQFRDRNKPFSLDWMLIALRFTGFLLVMVSATGLASLQFYDADQTLPFSNGGLLGEEIAAATEAAFSRVGATILLLAILFFGCTIFTDISWLYVMDVLGQLVFTTFDKSADYLRNRRIRKQEQKIAEKAQRERKAAVEVKTQQQVEKKPPKITPPVVIPPKKSERAQKEKQGTLFESGATGELPKLDLLDKVDENRETGFSEESLEAMSKLLELKLQDFGISAEVVSVQPGPVVTRFEIQPAPGVKASRITNLAKDLARSLSLVSVRVVEVIPGKSFVGIETPNEKRQMVRLSEVLSSEKYEKSKSPLTFALGHDISGQPVIADLAKMPHLLVAGTTGSGKSVGVNSMLISILYKASPKEVRLIMVDPKMLELSIYEGIPHLLTPVVTDMNDASNALRWCVGEMERRYRLMAAMGVRNLAGFNRKVEEANASGEPIDDPLWIPDPMLDASEQTVPHLDTLPFIVVVIDEFADMMMIVGKKVEQLIARIAQKARAAGIHLVLATQRPSVDVITGLIKANVPTRMAFQVSSKIDSRTILDQGGAEQLLGHGDMLYLPPGSGVPVRVHGAFVDDHEVHKVVEDWKQRGEPNYIDGIVSSEHTDVPVPGFSSESEGGKDDESDPLYDEAVEFVTQTRKASISSVQRKLRIGYNRAARLIETMEESGVVSPMNTNGSREVLAPPPPR